LTLLLEKWPTGQDTDKMEQFIHRRTWWYKVILTRYWNEMLRIL
jgi:hypothetical protein